MTSYNLMLDCQMLKASNGLLPNHQIDDDKQIGGKNVSKYIILRKNITKHFCFVI